MPAPLVLDAPPPLWRGYLRALLSRRPALAPPGTDAGLEAHLAPRAAPRDALRAYRALCAFPADGTLPITYPHLLAMPLHLAMLAAPGFPVRLLGLVHVANAITRARPIAEGEPLALLASLRGPREAARGQEFELVTEATAAGEPVWAETTTFLARRPGRERGPRPAAPAAAPALPRVARFALPAGLGRRYAAVSGDWNPIHLSAPSARLLGFPRAIAHGMATLARAASALEARGGAPLAALEASFKLPVLLPAAVDLRAGESGPEVPFALTGAGPDGDRPHVVGVARFEPR